MALEHFSVWNRTDGETQCRIYVEPAKRKCAVTVTIKGRIVAQRDETDAAFRSFTSADWTSVDHWDRLSAAIAKTWSPFWRGETAA